MCRILSDGNATTRRQLTNVLAVLDDFQFGSFEMFAPFESEDLSGLDSINITDIYKKVGETHHTMGARKYIPDHHFR